MFCAPKSSDFTWGGGQTTPLFFVPKSSVKVLLVDRTCLCGFRFHCLKNKTGIEVDSSKANLLKMALILVICSNRLYVPHILPLMYLLVIGISGAFSMNEDL